MIEPALMELILAVRPAMPNVPGLLLATSSQVPPEATLPGFV